MTGKANPKRNLDGSEKQEPRKRLGSIRDSLPIKFSKFDGHASSEKFRDSISEAHKAILEKDALDQAALQTKPENNRSQSAGPSTVTPDNKDNCVGEPPSSAEPAEPLPGLVSEHDDDYHTFMAESIFEGFKDTLKSLAEERTALNAKYSSPGDVETVQHAWKEEHLAQRTCGFRCSSTIYPRPFRGAHKKNGGFLYVRSMTGEQRYVVYCLYKCSQDYLELFGGERSAVTYARKIATVIFEAMQELEPQDRPFHIAMYDFANNVSVRTAVGVVQNVWCDWDAVFPEDFNPDVLESVVSGAFNAAVVTLKLLDSPKLDFSTQGKDKIERNVLKIGGRVILVDFGTKEAVMLARQDGDDVTALLTHGHGDHVDPLDSKHFKDLLKSGEAVLLCSRSTAAVVFNSNNALGLDHLHEVCVPGEHLMEAGSCYAVPGSQVKLYFYDSGHISGSVGVIAVDEATGEAAIHTGDQRFKGEMCLALRELLDTLAAKYEDLHISSAVVDDTRINLNSTEEAESVIQLAVDEVEAAFEAGFETVDVVFNYHRYGTRVSDLMLPLAERLDTYVEMVPESFDAVKALHDAGDARYSNIDRIFDATKKHEEEEEIPKTVIRQTARNDFYKEDFPEFLDELEYSIGGDKKCAIIALDTACYIKGRNAYFVEHDGFGSVKRIPVHYSEHSGLDEIVDFVSLLKKYGLKLENLTLLESARAEMNKRIGKIRAALKKKSKKKPS